MMSIGHLANVTGQLEAGMHKAIESAQKIDRIGSFIDTTCP
jgi:hypothetical protein